MDWAYSILCDQHQILASIESANCDWNILQGIGTDPTLSQAEDAPDTDYFEANTIVALGRNMDLKDSVNSWAQFYDLAVRDPACAEASRNRRQLDSQLRTSDNMVCELETKLNSLTRRSHMFDNMALGLATYSNIDTDQLPEAVPPMHIYQAAYSLALNSVRSRFECENRKRDLSEQRRLLQEQHHKIAEKAQDHVKGVDTEGASAAEDEERERFGALLAERANKMLSE